MSKYIMRAKINREFTASLPERKSYGFRDKSRLHAGLFRERGGEEPARKTACRFSENFVKLT